MQDLSELSIGQYNLVYNFFSFTVAVMAAATLFFWLQRPLVSKTYRTAITITGLVTAVAAYHYFRIYESWGDAFVITNGTLQLTGEPFNQAYRYVDWLLTVPLLLVELILVMRLSKSETVSKSVRLGILAAAMIILGYPGEVATDDGTRWTFWVLSMIPFVWIVYELVVGLGESIKKQPPKAAKLVSSARWLVIVSWLFYPIVFLFPMLGLSGAAATTIVEVGYSIADITAKAVFGFVIYLIAVKKSEEEEGEKPAVAA
jgi:bacteriorhodopsin